MVDKISVIRFLIEDCYKNFPELIEEIPKEEMYKILENNISTISLASKDIDIGIEDIKKEQDIAGTLAHEGIHALFRKNEDDTRN